MKGSWGSQNLRATDLGNQNKIYLFETQQVLNNHVSFPKLTLFSQALSLDKRPLLLPKQNPPSGLWRLLPPVSWSLGVLTILHLLSFALFSVAPPNPTHIPVTNPVDDTLFFSYLNLLSFALFFVAPPNPTHIPVTNTVDDNLFFSYLNLNVLYIFPLGLSN